MKAGLPGPGHRVRQLATAAEGEGEQKDTTKGNKGVPEDGPLKEYENRISQGRLRNDPYQRSMCACVVFFFIREGTSFANSSSLIRYH